MPLPLVYFNGPPKQEARQSSCRESNTPNDTIESVLNMRRRRLMSLPGVVGVARGECEGKPCIKVYVSRRTDDVLKRLPSRLDGFPVSVEETGEFRALGD